MKKNNNNKTLICSKGFVNGPCGGVSNDNCEVKKKKCIWVLVYKKLKKTKKINEFIKKYIPPR
jgi:hypothetical protein